MSVPSQHPIVRAVQWLGPSPVVGRGSARRRIHAVLTRALPVAALVAATVVVTTPAHRALAADPVSITVTGSPNPVSSGQALAYTINVADTGGATASGLTLTDSLSGLGIGAFASAP